MFSRVEGMSQSTKVQVHGFNVGRVQQIDNVDDHFRLFRLRIGFDADLRIPKNSYFTLKNTLLGGTVITLELGDDQQHFYAYGDTIPFVLTRKNPLRTAGTPDQTNPNISPTETARLTLQGIGVLVDTLTQFISQMNAFMRTSVHPYLPGILAQTHQSMQNLQTLSANLIAAEKTMHALFKDAAVLMQGLNQRVQDMSSVFAHVERFSKHLAHLRPDQWNEHISTCIERVKNVTISMDKLSQTIASEQGTLGLLIGDKSLYDNLNRSSASLNALLEDVRANPRRYVNIQLFGKRNKQAKPLPDSVFRRP